MVASCRGTPLHVYSCTCACIHMYMYMHVTCVNHPHNRLSLVLSEGFFEFEMTLNYLTVLWSYPCTTYDNAYILVQVDLSQEEPCLSLQCISSEQANITILTTGTSPSNGDVVHIFNQHNVRVGTTPTTPLPEVWRCVRVSQQA